MANLCSDRIPDIPVWVPPAGSPTGTHFPGLGSVGWLSGEGHHEHHGKGLVFLGALPGMERSIAVQKAREPQCIPRTDFEAHIVFIWMLYLKKSLACFLVKQFAEMFPLLLQLRPETDGSTHGA